MEGEVGHHPRLESAFALGLLLCARGSGDKKVNWGVRDMLAARLIASSTIHMRHDHMELAKPVMTKLGYARNAGMSRKTLLLSLMR